MKSLLGGAVSALVFGLAFGATAAQAAPGDTLREVKARGELVCGVTQGLDGFSLQDSEGNYGGLDVDYCRAVAAAVFGDASKVRFRPLSS